MNSNFLIIFDVYAPDYYDQCDHFFNFLDSAEQLKSQSFKFNSLKKKYIVSHGLLRCLLARFIEAKPSDIEYSFGLFGKPFLAKQKLSFNMSHSHNKVLYAFSNRVNVGIDVEYIKKDVDLNELPWDFLNLIQGNEFDFTNQLKNSKEYFYQKWSRLESYLKAQGLGICSKINEIQFDYQKWRSYDIPIKKSYSACLTYQNIDVNLSPRLKVLSRTDIEDLMH
ncbi:MAG: 4'-phosphopantetheinyl transferase Sfp [Chlamydiae bacterium]|nr:4'-phosphopantetheinyl transferase Sfp [Chlamydiota bacterium]